LTDRAPLPPIKFRELAEALLARADRLVPDWLPGGHRSGPEWVCAGLSGGKGSSCSVNLITGQWADFSSDEKGGDLISLYAAMHGLEMGKAAVQVARDEGLEDVAGVQPSAQHQHPAKPPPPPTPPKASRPPPPDEGWVTVRPVPAIATQPTFKHPHRQPEDIARTAEYRVGGELHGYVVRFRTSTGGKDDLPYTWCTSTHHGGSKWLWKQFDEPRPLYLPGRALPAGRTVVLVEGERKAELLQALLDAGAHGVYCVASWPGGCKVWKKADWSWLAGCTVLAWPDCDSKRVPLTAKERNALPEDARAAAAAAKPYLPADKQPGMAAMLGLGQHLQAQHGCTVSLLPIEPPGVLVDGWDAADAIESDGWDFARVQAFFARAYTLTAGEGAAAAGTQEPPEKKRDDPASAGQPEPQAGALPAWLKDFYDADKGRWMLSRKTVIKALRHDEHLAGVLGFNELSCSIEARQDWPFLHGRAGKLTNSTDLLLGDWLSTKYGIPSIGRQALMEGIETVAYESPFHPVRLWLQSLKWDGVNRRDKWLIHVTGYTPQELPPRHAEYLAAAGRYWLLGMVRRVMEPGCKFDYMPVLEGPGGLGKSTLVEVLASSAWYSDTAFDLSKGKESQEQIAGIWCYEVGELSAMAKAEVTAIKAFITSKVDRYRQAYGRVVEEHPRQCVLVGTTNESAYLRDRTGNRRFWPIPVTKPVRVAWLRKWREQLFAEAYALHLQGVPYTPSREEEARLFEPEQDARLVETGVTSELLHALTRDPGKGAHSETVNNLADFVTLSDLLKCLLVDAGKSNAGLESQIRTWMNQQGWEYKKRQVNKVRQAGWERPKKDWPPEEPAEDQPPAPAQAGDGPDPLNEDFLGDDPF
jgi:putative DNA primase/helicase